MKPSDATSGGPLLHLTHLEDRIFVEGSVGVRRAINALRAVRDTLAGDSSKKIDVREKFDGSPAVIFGYQNGKFFAGTKSVFAKAAKINYTEEDVKRNHESEGLQKKLILALQYLPKITPKDTIWQADFLFDESDIDTVNMNGELLYTFKPNTITYAVPVDSELGKRVDVAHIGLIVHTRYKSLENASPDFNVSVDAFKSNKDIFLIDANARNMSGNAVMTASETEQVNELLKSAIKRFTSINARWLDTLKIESNKSQLIMTFINSYIRAGSAVPNAKTFVKDFDHWLRERGKKAADKLKTVDSKEKAIAKAQGDYDWFTSPESELLTVVEIFRDLQQAKDILVKKLMHVSKMKTFIQQSNGDLRVTVPEGFVVVHQGSYVKFVDRLEFSKENFHRNIKESLMLMPLNVKDIPGDA